MTVCDISREKNLKMGPNVLVLALRFTLDSLTDVNNCWLATFPTEYFCFRVTEGLCLE